MGSIVGLAVAGPLGFLWEVIWVAKLALAAQSSIGEDTPKDEKVQGEKRYL